MIRAVIFDFFSVIMPDIYEPLIANAAQVSPELADSIKKEINQYLFGIYNLKELIRSLEIIFRTKEIPTASLKIDMSELPTEIIDIARQLHMHFLKVSIIGNIGNQEIELLTDFDKEKHEFELIAGPGNFGEPLLSNSFFESALNAIGEPPQNCLLISGHYDYIEFAKSIGLKTMHFTNYDIFNNEIWQYLKLN